MRRAEAHFERPEFDAVERSHIVSRAAASPSFATESRSRTGPKLEFREPTSATDCAGAVAPNSPANGKWLRPFGTLTGKYGHPLLYTYSLIIALVCGTAGLPHILVRSIPTRTAARPSGRRSG